MENKLKLPCKKTLIVLSQLRVWYRLNFSWVNSPLSSRVKFFSQLREAWNSVQNIQFWKRGFEEVRAVIGCPSRASNIQSETRVSVDLRRFSVQFYARSLILGPIPDSLSKMQFPDAGLLRSPIRDVRAIAKCGRQGLG